MPEKSSSRKPLLVLGGGYVGKALSAARSVTLDVVLTSRSGQRGAVGDAQSPELFDLSRRETWDLVAAYDHILWTFPAATSHADVRIAITFFEEMKLAQKKVMVLGSTSCFIHKMPGELVDESFPLDLTQPRVIAEEQLRQRSALILCLAGIYGAGRDPADWLRRGLVKNGESFINLIHVNDIIKIIEHWRFSEENFAGKRIVASDGRHRRWHEVFEQMCSVGLLNATARPFEQSLVQSATSKRVNNTVLREKLYAGPFHRYPEDGL
jgi:nucleoside-diphosphate-sugar epimerase